MDTNSDREYTRIGTNKSKPQMDPPPLRYGATGCRFTQIKSVSACLENSHRRARQGFGPTSGTIGECEQCRERGSVLREPRPTKLRWRIYIERNQSPLMRLS